MGCSKVAFSAVAFPVDQGYGNLFKDFALIHLQVHNCLVVLLLEQRATISWTVSVTTLLSPDKNAKGKQS